MWRSKPVILVLLTLKRNVWVNFEDKWCGLYRWISCKIFYKWKSQFWLETNLEWYGLYHWICCKIFCKNWKCQFWLKIYFTKEPKIGDRNISYEPQYPSYFWRQKTMRFIPLNLSWNFLSIWKSKFWFFSL